MFRANFRQFLCKLIVSHVLYCFDCEFAYVISILLSFGVDILFEFERPMLPTKYLIDYRIFVFFLTNHFVSGCTFRVVVAVAAFFSAPGSSPLAKATNVTLFTVFVCWNISDALGYDFLVLTGEVGLVVHGYAGVMSPNFIQVGLCCCVSLFFEVVVKNRNIFLGLHSLIRKVNIFFQRWNSAQIVIELFIM